MEIVRINYCCIRFSLLEQEHDIHDVPSLLPIHHMPLSLLPRILLAQIPCQQCANSSQGLAASKAAIVINYNIALFYSVAFAPNGAHFFAFKNKSGGTQWVFSQVNDKAPWFKGRKECKCWTLRLLHVYLLERTRYSMKDVVVDEYRYYS